MACCSWKEEDPAIDRRVTARRKRSGGLQLHSRWFLQRAHHAVALIKNKHAVSRSAIWPAGEGEHRRAAGRKRDVLIGKSQCRIAAGDEHSTGSGKREAREFRKNQVKERGNIEGAKSMGRGLDGRSAASSGCIRLSANALGTPGAAQRNPDFAGSAP